MQRSAGTLLSNRRVSSQPVQVLDPVTLLIPQFCYDGSGKEVYFWVGSGPYSEGTKTPDEAGYLEPLRRYSGEDVLLRLPGLTVADVTWLAVWDAGAQELLAAVQLSADVPAMPVVLHPHTPAFRNCKQLHSEIQFSWEVIGNTLYCQVNAKMGDNEYTAFSFSPNPHASSEPGAAVTVVSSPSVGGQGYATDYIVSDGVPCVVTSSEWKGVCELKKRGSHSVLRASRIDGISSVTFRMKIKPDLKFPLASPVTVTFASGELDGGQPAFHRRYSRYPINVTLFREANDSEKADDCFPFVLSPPLPPARRWPAAALPDERTLRFTLGPPAPARAAPPLVFYVNGLPAPALRLTRGNTYTLQIQGGNDPHSASEYHPLIVAASPAGGLGRLSEEEQRAVEVLAGVHTPTRGRLEPTAAGPKCVAERPRGADPRRDYMYPTFGAFSRTLTERCAPGAPAFLQLKPDDSWPDRLYYDSFSHTGMGGVIYIADPSSAAATPAPPHTALEETIAVLLVLVAALVVLLVFNICRQRERTHSPIPQLPSP